ncbi:Rieske (2Fe-2S) protein [Rothia nasimurium]|uniref:Rieske (2Fe-2S) protein n=1 Tax=Rothia nasimurium TaxID=85336 RepID=UPI003BA0B973
MCTSCGCQEQTKDQTDQQAAGLTRRRAVAGTLAAGAGALALSACSSSGSSEPLTAEDGRPTQATDMAAAADVPVGGVIKATAGGFSAMISQPAEGEFHAFSSVCTHQGCQLNALKDKSMSCPCHASVFDLTTGAVQGGPAELPLPEFTVEVKDGRIWVS